MRAKTLLVVCMLWVGCSSSSPAPTGDAGVDHPSAGGKDGASDAEVGGSADLRADKALADTGSGGDVARDSSADAAKAPTTACPAAHPGFGATCAGTLSCEYGQASCCGIQMSAQTCTCQNGFFNCAQTTECNVTCPDGGFG
jgi:hypothetical protein